MALVQVLEGRPTGPQATKLGDAIKHAIANGTPNRVFTHDDIATLIDEKRGTARYRTVMYAAFRRVFRDTGYAMKSLPGMGYQIPTGTEQIEMGVGDHRRAAKTLRRGVAKVGFIVDDRLDEQGRAKRDYYVTSAKLLAELAKTKTKELQLTLGSTGTLPAPTS